MGSEIVLEFAFYGDKWEGENCGYNGKVHEKLCKGYQA